MLHEGLAVSGCDLKPDWKVNWYPVDFLTAKCPDFLSLKPDRKVKWYLVDFSTVKFPVCLSLRAHTEDKEKWVPPAGTQAVFLGVLESPH